MAYQPDPPLLYERGRSVAARVPAGGDDAFYSLDYDSRSPSANMAFPHFHSYYELMIPLSAGVSHFVEGTRYDLEPYDVVLLAPSVLHQSVYPPGPPSDRLVAGFRPPAGGPFAEGLRAALSAFGAPCPILRLSPEHRRRLFAPLNALFSLPEADGPVRELAIHAGFLQFLLEMHRLRGENLYVAAAHPGVEGKIYAVCHYLHTHYREELSLPSLAAAFFMSPYYLSRRFREVTGYTVTRYLQLTRVRNAQVLLLHSDRSITAVAEEAGFTSFSQFNRVFRSVCGASPSAYRREGGEGGSPAGGSRKIPR